MILQALERYYSILSSDEESGIAPLGYSSANVSYALTLSADGALQGIIPLRQTVQRGKKTVEVPQAMLIPEQSKRSVGIRANFLCDNSSYVFGIDNKGKPERAKQCFEAFQQLHEQVLDGVSCDEASAIVNFVQKWDCDKAAENSVLAPYLEEISKGANLVFKLDGGGYLHKNPEMKRAWENYISSAENSGEKMQCLVTGEICEIARLHPNLKGVRGAQAMGAAIVSFNAKAYESYGRDDGQGLNAPVGKYAAFAYGTALNYLLANPNNRFSIGDTTVVFWAETSNPQYNAFFSMFLNPPDEGKKDDNTLRRDEKTEILVRDYMKKMASGLPAQPFEGADENVGFYILGLSPNAARLSVRFFIRDNFGGFLKKVTQHYENMRVQKQFAGERETIPPWKLLSETVSPNAKEKTASPLLEGAVMRSILTGAAYPAILYQTLLLRVKAEREVTYGKAAGIKACLTRKDLFKEVLSVALNEQSDNKAYVLGRLFAVLEKAQEEANGSSTMKDRFFTSACATPGSVFPTLLKLSGHHVSKAEYGLRFEKMTGDLLGRLNVEKTPFPAHLTLEEQGLFILGYYQQRTSFFTKH